MDFLDKGMAVSKRLARFMALREEFVDAPRRAADEAEAELKAQWPAEGMAEALAKWPRTNAGLIVGTLVAETAVAEAKF